MGYLYVIKCRTHGDYKIGVSGNVRKRLQVIRRDYPGHGIWLLFSESIGGRNGEYALEELLHRYFAEQRSSHRMGVEWFELSEEDLDVVKAAATLFRDSVGMGVDWARTQTCSALRRGNVRLLLLQADLAREMELWEKKSQALKEWVEATDAHSKRAAKDRFVRLCKRWEEVSARLKGRWGT